MFQGNVTEFGSGGLKPKMRGQLDRKIICK